MGVAERKLERAFKGMANHRRIEVLRLLRRRPGLPLGRIAHEVNVDFRVVAEHTRRLVAAGLVFKRNHGREVRHRLSPLGKKMLEFSDRLI